MDLLTIKMPKCLAVCLVWLVLAVFSVRSSPVVNRVHVLDIPADFPTEDTQVIQNLEFHLRLKRQVTDEKVTTLKPESLTTKPDVSPSPKENDDSVDASGLSAVDNNGKNLPSTAKIPGVSPQNLGSDAATNVDLPVEHTTTRTSLTSAAQVGDSLDAGEGKQDYSMTSALPDLKPAGRVESLSGLGNSSPEQTTHSVTSTTTAALVTPAEEHRAAPIEAPPKAGNKTDITTVAPEAVGDVDMAPPPPATAPAHVVTTPKSPITAPLTIAGPLNNATPTTNVAMMTEKPKVLNATHFQMPPDAAPEASKQEETTTNAATITEKPKVLNTTHLQMPPDAAPEASKLEETTTTAVSEVVTTGMDISEVVAPYLASPANETGEESEGKVNKTESKSTIASEISGVIVPDLNTTTSDSLSDIPTAPLTLGKTGSNTTIFQETNTTVAMVIDSVENVTSAFLGSGILPGMEVNTTSAQNTTSTTVTNVTEPTTEEPANASLPYLPEVADITNATTTPQPPTTADGIIDDVSNVTNTTTQVPLNTTVVSATELDTNVTNATSMPFTTNVTMATTELVNTTTQAAYPVTIKTTTLEPPTPNTTLVRNTTVAASTTTKSTLQEITVTIPTTTTPATTQNSTNHSAPVGRSQELSASALTAIITGSIIGFWIILGPIICLICKVRDKRKERYHTRLTNHSDPPADNGMLDAMIISELKKTSESSHDNGTTGKEKEYNTVANDKEETDRLRSNTAEHEF